VVPVVILALFCIVAVHFLPADDLCLLTSIYATYLWSTQELFTSIITLQCIRYRHKLK